MLVTFSHPGVYILTEGLSFRKSNDNYKEASQYLHILARCKISALPCQYRNGLISQTAIFTPALSLSLSTWREQVLSAGGQRAEAKSKAADRSPTQNIDITSWSEKQGVTQQSVRFTPHSAHNNSDLISEEWVLNRTVNVEPLFRSISNFQISQNLCHGWNR